MKVPLSTSGPLAFIPRTVSEEKRGLNWVHSTLGFGRSRRSVPLLALLLGDFDPSPQGLTKMGADLPAVPVSKLPISSHCAIHVRDLPASEIWEFGCRDQAP